jgi:hypothetical protein
MFLSLMRINNIQEASAWIDFRLKNEPHKERFWEGGSGWLSMGTCVRKIHTHARSGTGALAWLNPLPPPGASAVEATG